MKKLTGLLALILVLALALTACGPKDGTADAPTASPSPTVSPSPSAAPTVTPSADPTPRPGMWEGKTLRVGITYEPPRLDPTWITGDREVTVLSALGEGLMRWEDSGVTLDGAVNSAALGLGQAASYEKTVEEGVTVYTFTLRDDIYWSDGLPVTAHDFVYAWQRLANPAYGAPYRYLIYGVEKAYEINSWKAEAKELGIKAEDDKTLVIRLEDDDPEFLEICAHPCTWPVRHDKVDENMSTWSEDPKTWVGNGPYALSAWSYYDTLTLVKNEHYYREIEGPETLEFHYEADEEAMLRDFNAGKLDFIGGVPAGTEGAGCLPWTGVYYLMYNLDIEPFDDARVRQALTLAVDRAALMEEHIKEGTVADGYVPHGISGSYGPTGDDFRTEGGGYWDNDAYAENCEKARALLAEAGYPEGEGFPEVKYLYNTFDYHEELALALTKMWKDVLGVEITAEGKGWSDYLDDRTGQDYAIIKTSWFAELDQPIAFLGLYGETSDECMELSDRAVEEPDLAVRTGYLHQMEDVILGRDWLVCPLYFFTTDYMADSKVGGVYYSPLGNFYFDSAKVG